MSQFPDLTARQRIKLIADCSSVLVTLTDIQDAVWREGIGDARIAVRNLLQELVKTI